MRPGTQSLARAPSCPVAFQIASTRIDGRRASTKPSREPARSPPVAIYPFPSARNHVTTRFTAPAPPPSPQLRAAACNKSELHRWYFLSGFCADRPCRSPRNATRNRQRQKVLGVWSAPGPGESACFLPADVRRAGEASPEPFKGGRQTAFDFQTLKWLWSQKSTRGARARASCVGSGLWPRLPPPTCARPVSGVHNNRITTRPGTLLSCGFFAAVSRPPPAASFPLCDL